MASRGSLKQGEKILFGIAIAFIAFAISAYIAIEAYRLSSSEPVFENLTSFDLSPEGHRGALVFRENGCSACHRALRSGTNMGLSLDGVGSRRSQEWLYDFLRDPEATYGSPTLDHGYSPKEAAYVSSLPDEDLRLMSVFLSELKSERGSPSAPAPPEGRSSFIDGMVKMFAPEEWEEKYGDVREEDPEDAPRRPGE